MLKRVADLEGLMLVVIGLACAGMLSITVSYPRTPAEFPRLIAGITLTCCLYMIGGRLAGRIHASPIRGIGKDGPRWWAFSVALMAYYAAILVFGFLPATFAFVLMVPIWISHKWTSWPTALIFAAAITAAFGAAMTWIMKIPIPSGMFFR